MTAASSPSTVVGPLTSTASAVGASLFNTNFSLIHATNVNIRNPALLNNMIKRTSSAFELIPEEVEEAESATTSNYPIYQQLSMPEVETEKTRCSTSLANEQYTQQVLNIKQQQVQQQIMLEQQFYINRELLKEEHDKQLNALVQQAEIQRVAQEECTALEKLRLENIKQKSMAEQSAVASPEVKRHLHEFVLQKRRREASVISNSNTTTCAGVVSPQSKLVPLILRKTASESNLHKMRIKRTTSEVRVGVNPYPKLPVTIRERTQPSYASAPSSPTSLLLAASQVSKSSFVKETVPHSGLTKPIPLSLTLLKNDAGINSRSLPNIASAVGTVTKNINQDHSRTPLTLKYHELCRGKSSAILPLKKLLKNKSLHTSMEEEQSYLKQRIEQLTRTHSIIELQQNQDKKMQNAMEVKDGICNVPIQLTGIGFDERMLEHRCNCDDSNIHPENPDRLRAVWQHLQATGLTDFCQKVSRQATSDEIKMCHSDFYVSTFANELSSSSLNDGEHQQRHLLTLPCGGIGVDSDTYWNKEHTPLALTVAAGTVIELSQKIGKGELRNGFALIRPPGHHAEYEEAMGFCFFNNIAIAAKHLLSLPNIKRVLIVDWAIHHGNGTQKLFYDNPDIMYISLHRHDNGNFYPGTGNFTECGSGIGIGFNINIPWTGGLDPPMGDAEYLAAFRSIVMPISRTFNPDFVLVSAGFDAAAGHPHPIGGYIVSTACFAYLTLQLRSLAKGKLMLVLEGGFNLDILKSTVEQCLAALLGQPINKITEFELARRPCFTACVTLQQVLAIQSAYWEILRFSTQSFILSHLEAWEKEKEKEETDNLTEMAFLSVAGSAKSNLRPNISVVPLHSNNDVVNSNEENEKFVSDYA